jgi:hypothetical protein
MLLGLTVDGPRPSAEAKSVTPPFILPNCRIIKNTQSGSPVLETRHYYLPICMVKPPLSNTSSREVDRTECAMWHCLSEIVNTFPGDFAREKLNLAQPGQCPEAQQSSVGHFRTTKQYLVKFVHLQKVL